MLLLYAYFSNRSSQIMYLDRNEIATMRFVIIIDKKYIRYIVENRILEY